MRHQHGCVFDGFRKRYFYQPTFLQLNFLAWCGIAVILFWVRWVIYKDLTRALVITLGADTLGFLLTCALRHFYRKTALPFPRPTVLRQSRSMQLRHHIAQGHVNVPWLEV